MVRKTMTVQLTAGLEARPIAMLVQVASQYDSKIYVETGSKRVNAKSIILQWNLCWRGSYRICRRSR